MRKQFNGCKATAAPWSGEVAKHCFDTGINQASLHWPTGHHRSRVFGPAAGLGSRAFSHSTNQIVGDVRGTEPSAVMAAPVTPHVRLMLPQALLRSKDARVRRQMQQLVWLHTVDSTRRLFRLVEDGKQRSNR